MGLYLDDFEPGQRFVGAARMCVDRDRIKRKLERTNPGYDA